MTRPTLYRVDIGEDCYIGSADEVIAFMRKAEGAPEGDVRAYMEGVAKRIHELTGRGPIATSDAEAFLESLSQHKVARVTVSDVPSEDRVNPADVLNDGPIAFGPDVDPRDIDF